MNMKMNAINLIKTLGVAMTENSFYLIVANIYQKLSTFSVAFRQTIALNRCF